MERGNFKYVALFLFPHVKLRNYRVYANIIHIKQLLSISVVSSLIYG